MKQTQTLMIVLSILTIYILIKIDPIIFLFNLVPRYTCYYGEKDIHITDLIKDKSIAQTNLYSDKLLSHIIGTGIYDTTTIKLDNSTIDIEQVYLYINNVDCIYFTISTFNKEQKSGEFNPGSYKYSITGGTGTFINSKGIVEYNVDANKVRTVNIYLHPF